MTTVLRLIAIVALVSIAACSNDNHTIEQDMAAPRLASSMKMMAEPAQESSGASYLAYEHSITLDMAASEVAPAYQQLVARCNQQPKGLCTLMTSNLQTGEQSYAHLRMRMPPDQVQPMLTHAGTLGEVTHQNTQVDDLQNAIVDNAKRIEMLESYRAKLQALETTSAKEVESLIRIASELSRVQSDLEYAQGEKARLRQRVDLQVVNIHLQTQSYTGFWSPITQSLSDFGRHFAQGTAHTLTVLAYGLPGFGVLLLVVLVLRMLWRRRH